MTLSIIVAMAEGGVIGNKNKLPWHLSEDLKRFKALTMGHPIIMGRKTYDSIGRPLPGRKNIVITRNPSLSIDGVTVVSSLEKALWVAGPESEELFVIGGATIFKEALPQAQRLYLTQIHHKFPGDIIFPPLDLEKDFRIIEKTLHKTEGAEPLSYSFITAERVNS